MTPYVFDELYSRLYLFLVKTAGFIFNVDYNFVSDFFMFLKTLAVLLSALFAAGIGYNLWRIARYRKKQIAEIVKFIIEPAAETRMSRWDKIKNSLNSENSDDWKTAICEADNIIDDILKRAGYKGNNLGERLLRIRPYAFQNIVKLFKAHILHNRIIRRGSGFELTKEKTGEILNLYEEALKEMGYL